MSDVMVSSGGPAAPPRPEGIDPDAIWIDEVGEWELASRDADGRKEGTVRTWRADGTLASESVQRAGKLHGTFRRFHPDGTVAREGVYVDGLAIGDMVSTASDGPTTEPLQSCCVPPGAWRKLITFREGEPGEVRWYDRTGAHILPSGRPYPPRPASVPPTAFFDEGADCWIRATSSVDATGVGSAEWVRWSTEGVLRDEDRLRDGIPHGVRRRYDARGRLAEEVSWRLGHRDGPARRLSLPPGTYDDPDVEDERGTFADDQAVGLWTLHDRDGAVRHRYDLGAPVDETALVSALASTLEGTGAVPPDGWEAEVARLEADGRMAEALVAAARAAAVADAVGPLRAALARRAPPLTREAAEALAAELIEGAAGKLAPLANGLVRGAAPATLLRALAVALGGSDRVALELADAALLLAPLRPDCLSTRALINLYLGRPDTARADIARLPADWEEHRQFLETYARVVYPRFDFWPARAEIRTQHTDLPVGPDQPLAALRAQIQKYATRLALIREALRARAGGDGLPGWLPPEPIGLLPEGPLPLETWEFEEVVVDESGAPIEGPASCVTVDEQLALEGGLQIPELMRLARVHWNALAWLCWSAGLDEVALPEAVHPRATFGAAAAMAVERLWRCRDQLTTSGLRSMTHSVPGFVWEGIEIETAARPIAEIATEEHLELRALFYWLADQGIQSPWQDNLRDPD